jgi:hypothetical protein
MGTEKKFPCLLIFIVYFCFCTISPAGAVAGLNTAPAPLGNTQLTELALSPDARNYISPTPSSIPEHPASLLLVPSSDKIWHFTLMALFAAPKFAFFY